MLPRLNFDRQSGFTLVELLIVIAIIAILALILLFLNWRRQIDRAYDIRRKADLARVRTGFEDYYNDNACYPASGALNTCGATTLSPHLKTIPCDPQTKNPYLYVFPDPAKSCSGYVICAALKDLQDPDIARIGCDPVAGCGWGVGYNYCLSAGTPAALPGFGPVGGGGSGAPTPTPALNGIYACTRSGDCNGYDNPANHGCPVSWPLGCPPGACSIITNRCKN